MAVSVGAVLMLICVVWFVVLSVQTAGSTAEKVVWAVVNLLFQPLAGIVFFFVKKSGLIPMLIGIVAVIFYGYGIFTSMGDVLNHLPH